MEQCFPSLQAYAFYDLDGSGSRELLLLNAGGDRILEIVAMVDGKTNEGKYYRILPCEDGVMIDEALSEDEEEPTVIRYHIFRFTPAENAPFSNPREESIVRLWHDVEGELGTPRPVVAHFLH